VDKIEKYADGWSKAEMDAFDTVMGNPTMPDYKHPFYDEWLFHKAWQAALAAAPTPPAQEAEPVAWMVPHRMSVSRHGGPSKEEISYHPWHRADKDRYVEDEHGAKHFPYPLYTHPANDKLRQAAEEAIKLLEDSSGGYCREAANLRAELEGKS
jgi:hypothetical protein